jgi:hypothetical protein
VAAGSEEKAALGYVIRSRVNAARHQGKLPSAFQICWISVLRPWRDLCTPWVLRQRRPDPTRASNATRAARRPIWPYTKQGCSTDCVWFDEHVEESIHGQWLSRDSSLSDQQYGYDKVGRLVRVEDAPTGQGCTTRSYSYDVNSNRLS